MMQRNHCKFPKRFRTYQTTPYPAFPETPKGAKKPPLATGGGFMINNKKAVRIELPFIFIFTIFIFICIK